MKKIKDLIIKYQHLISYVLVGTLSTIVNFAVFFLLDFTDLNFIWKNNAAWAAAVVFSFFANRKYVFHSVAKSRSAKFNEFIAFALSRVFSLIVEDVALSIFVHFGFSENLAKVPVSVFVMILNYITGHIVFVGKNEVKKRAKEIISRLKRDTNRN